LNQEAIDELRRLQSLLAQAESTRHPGDEE